MPIFMIRHGETALNAARVLQLPDTPLSSRGEEQAESLGRRLIELGVARIVSSDLTRARMTAERIRDRVSAPLELDPLLRERNFGDLRGTPYAELESDPFAAGSSPPAGETWEVFHERVDRVWSRMQEWAEEVEGPVAVVTHGLVCHSIAARHIDLPADLTTPDRDSPPLLFGNASLSILRGPAPWVADLLGCTAHLVGDATGDPRGAPV